MGTVFSAASLRQGLTRLLVRAGRQFAALRRRPREDFGYRLTRAQRIGFADAGFPRNCLLRLVDFPGLLLRSGTRETIKVGRTALVVRAEVPVGGRMLSVAYKRIRRRTWLKTLTSFLQPQRVVRTWRMGHELRTRGIETPRPLAVIVPRRFARCRDSWLVTKWLDRGQSLSAFLDHVGQAASLPGLRESAAEAGSFGHNADQRLVRAAADCVGRLIGRMHAAGIAHRDLKPSNLMLEAADSGLRAWVIDLDGATLLSHVPHGRRLRNLARLVVGLAHRREITRTVRLRFLQSYLAAAGEASRPWKDCWSSLAQIARRRSESRLAARNSAPRRPRL